MAPPGDLDGLSHAKLKGLVVKQWEEMVELQRMVEAFDPRGTDRQSRRTTARLPLQRLHELRGAGFGDPLAAAAPARLIPFHAPEVECIGRGKASAPYEFGAKASITTTTARTPGGVCVLHAAALPGNPSDGHTLGGVIAATEAHPPLDGILAIRLFWSRDESLGTHARRWQRRFR